MTTETYDGYEIIPASYQLADDGKWAVQVYIAKEVGSERRERQFSAGNTFDKKARAERHCLDFGRKIIDGEIPGCSVDNL